MGHLTKHWTERSIEDFLYRVGFDFVQQIEELMKPSGTSQTELAKKLGVTEGRVSQVLNNPGNLTLRKVIEYARALQKKVAIVVYDDGDPDNANGPVNAEVFARCWDRSGKPSDFFALDDDMSRVATIASVMPAGTSYRLPDRVTPRFGNIMRQQTQNDANSIGEKAQSAVSSFKPPDMNSPGSMASGSHYL
ncbi:MAG: helix-turn-helix transcriptional regulator [Candidatus Solibacter sp.]|nr:helix-turn-helix transcriptional regulator [Candidatus Solibacter sp.]